MHKMSLYDPLLHIIKKKDTSPINMKNSDANDNMDFRGWKLWI